MSRKGKGISAERELIHLFWAAGWAACRVAGSGAIKYPCPDIIAGCEHRRLAVECKASGEGYQYIEGRTIQKLKDFCARFAAEPWIGVRFDRDGWFFVSLDEIHLSGQGRTISLDSAKSRGVLFEELIMAKY